MSWFQSAAAWTQRAFKWASMPLRDPGLAAFFGPPETNSGIEVNEISALNQSAVFAAIRILAETMGSLELDLMRIEPDGTRKIAYDHDVYRLLHNQPNPEMTAMSARETMMAHVCSWGNAYAEIQRKKSGRPYAIWPLTPNRVRPRRVIETKQIVYDVFPNAASAYSVQALPLNDGQMVTIPKEDMVHVPGLGFDGLIGYSVITLARESIGLGLATERFGAGFFGQGARPSGYIKHPGRLKPEARKNLRESFQRLHGGLKNAHRIALLEEGVEWEQLGIPPEDAQFLQTRKFQISEIARWFNVPPHMLKELDRATFSNIEHQGIEFVNYTIYPWTVRFCQEYWRKLLAAPEKQNYEWKYAVGRLTMGDMQSRFNAYATAIQNGFKSPDDVLDMEGENHLPNGEGKAYTRPMNVVQVGPNAVPVTPVQPTAPDPAEPVPDPETQAAEDKKLKEKKDAKKAKKAKRDAISAAHRAALTDVFVRMGGVEAQALRRAAKTPATFLKTTEEFYGRFERMLSAAAKPALRAHLAFTRFGADVDAETDQAAREYCSRSRELLLRACECPPAELDASIEALAKRFETDRPAETVESLLMEPSHGT